MGGILQMNYNNSDITSQEAFLQNKKLQEGKRKKQELNMPLEWQNISMSAQSKIIKQITYHKWQNVKVCAALRSIGEKERANLINECGTFVRLGKRNGHDSIKYANFCRQRLCSVCGWRRSAKFVSQMIPVTKILSGQGYKFVFLTLTIPNCYDDELNENVSMLLKGWDRLNKRRKNQRAWRGFCRSIEVSYNTKTNTYHPHIHALIACDTKYYNSVKQADAARVGDYMNDLELKLQEEWRQCLRIQKLEHPLQVKLLPANRAKGHNNQSISTAAAVETLKYAYKINNKAISNKTISTLLYSLCNKRLVSFGGVIAGTRQQLNQGEIEPDSFIDESEENPQETPDNVLYIFNMNGWKIIEEGEQ